MCCSLAAALVIQTQQQQKLSAQNPAKLMWFFYPTSPAEWDGTAESPDWHRRDSI